MDLIASNIANANTTQTDEGGPYRRKTPVFTTGVAGAGIGVESGQGVRVSAIAQDMSPPRMIYEPGHPEADAEGYVAMPNVNPVTEMVNMMIATRAYEANTTAIEAAKSMITSSINMLT